MENKRMIRSWPETNRKYKRGNLLPSPNPNETKAIITNRIIAKYIIPNYKENEANKYKRYFKENT